MLTFPSVWSGLPSQRQTFQRTGHRVTSLQTLRALPASDKGPGLRCS